MLPQQDLARLSLLSDRRVVTVVMFGYATIVSVLATAVSAGIVFSILSY